MADAALFPAFVPILLDIPVAASSTSGSVCVRACVGERERNYV